MEKNINSKIIRKRDEYDSISTGSRRALIKLIFEHNVSIRIATNYLGLKYSTGKTLVQQYRRTGLIDRVKKQRAKRNRKSINFDFRGELNQLNPNALFQNDPNVEDEEAPMEEESISLDMEVVARLQRNESIVHESLLRNINKQQEKKDMIAGIHKILPKPNSSFSVQQPPHLQSIGLFAGVQSKQISDQPTFAKSSFIGGALNSELLHLQNICQSNASFNDNSSQLLSSLDMRKNNRFGGSCMEHSEGGFSATFQISSPKTPRSHSIFNQKVPINPSLFKLKSLNKNRLVQNAQPSQSSPSASSVLETQVLASDHPSTSFNFGIYSPQILDSWKNHQQQEMLASIGQLSKTFQERDRVYYSILQSMFDNKTMDFGLISAPELVKPQIQNSVEAQFLQNSITSYRDQHQRISLPSVSLNNNQQSQCSQSSHDPKVREIRGDLKISSSQKMLRKKAALNASLLTKKLKLLDHSKLNELYMPLKEQLENSENKIITSPDYEGSQEFNTQHGTHHLL